MLPTLLSALDFKAIGNFFNQGGIFMYALAATSFVALAAIVFKIMSLSRQAVVPLELEQAINRAEEQGDVGELASASNSGRSSLARLCNIAIRNRGKSRADITDAVQTSARDEVVQMNSGMIILDTIITVAPLFGLLGTASGLVVIFNGLGDTTDHNMVARGIGRALDNTIVGLAIAVPAVVAHGWFSRRIEVLVSKLEVLLARVARLCEGAGTAESAAAAAKGSGKSAPPTLPRVPERP
ncbi:MotA/TolQ/ExbB proton channel family protein [Haloferula sp. BvORR071]|uniref:MotA/TolQ/ExbB proton channel family protein n=1 Tax=Haloferula sp. BvORR071 TaxID=1396141 RepID=UPI00054F6057|nr:MotA/TolQ/ExbB proton channel family protein [Haloferula sp. BvORR071]